MSTSTQSVTPARKTQSSSAVNDPADELLARVQAHPGVVQELVSLAQSLEWDLGQEYLKSRGAKAFTADSSPVPFWVNNDGSLSRKAAELFYEAMEENGERCAKATDGADIYVLELGVGVGLFARFFLDRLRELCRQQRRDYYDRLCYTLADRSPRMLMDVARHGILADHAGHFRLRVTDALKVDEALPYDVAFSGQRSAARKNGRFHAVFLNYLLDCLPAAVVRVEGDEVKQLCVRTCVGRNVNLAEHTDMSLAALRERAKMVAAGDGSAASARARQELLEVYSLFASEYAFEPVAAVDVPCADFVLPYARERGKPVLLNYGAIQCLDKLLTLIEPGGFILMNEYGMSQESEEDDFEHQRFSQTTAVGLNFPLLQAYFTSGQQSAVSDQKAAISDQLSAVSDQQPGASGPEAVVLHAPADRCSLNAGRSLMWIEPEGDEKRGIHTRLLGWDMGEQTVGRFHERFKLSAFEWTEAPVNKARECVKAGRFETAASFYREALRRQPRNWVLLNEIAGFVTYSLHDPKTGADMAKLALRLNPACSSDLWCTLGDALFEWGRTAEAKSAYLRALAINPGDVRGRFNLAFVHTRQKNYRPALAMIADALALDKTGQYRERLLQKQAEVLQLVAVRHQAEYLRMVNLVSKPE